MDILRICFKNAILKLSLNFKSFIIFGIKFIFPIVLISFLQRGLIGIYFPVECTGNETITTSAGADSLNKRLKPVTIEGEGCLLIMQSLLHLYMLI